MFVSDVPEPKSSARQKSKTVPNFRDLLEHITHIALLPLQPPLFIQGLSYLELDGLLLLSSSERVYDGATVVTKTLDHRMI